MKEKIYTRYIVLIFIISAMLLPGCGDKALFDELAENRLTVIVKGTYESNNPRDWTGAGTIGEDDSVYVWPGAVDDEEPTKFMIDIAGLKIASGKFDEYFAYYRETYSAPLYDESDPFFNGTGFKYRNDDVQSDFFYNYVEMYIRKMIFNNAKQYDATGVYTWDYDRDVEVIFREKDTYGLNFNLFMALTYYDSLKENRGDINRVFPLKIPIEDGLTFDNEEEETVLEIRLVIKNFIKKYEYEYTDDNDNQKLRHFYAFSDWLRYVEREEPGDALLGGNLLSVARVYIPGKTATITGTALNSDRYIIAVNSNHSVIEYEPSDRIRPDCDKPKSPRYPVYPSDEDNYVQAMLDYYLQYEVYKEDYDGFVDCVDDGTYELEWDAYNDSLNDYRIPALVTWTSDGTFQFTNVPEGSYTIYESSDTPDQGELPEDFGTPIGTANVTSDDFNSSVPME